MGLLSNFIKNKDQKVIGVDIGSSSVKIVQLHKTSGKVYLDSYGEFSLASYVNKVVGQATSLPIEKIVAGTSSLLLDSNINTKVAGMAIPFRSSMVSLIKMPKVPEKQLNEMVPIEARKYIPSSLDEVTLDWSVIGTTEVSGVEQLKILLVAIHNNIIEKYKQISEGVKLDILFYEIEVFSAARALLNTDFSKPSIIIDMGANSTNFYVILEGNIEVSHTIGRGSQDISAAISKSSGLDIKEAEMVKRDIGLSKNNPNIKKAVEMNLEYIFAEIERLITNYQNKNSLAIDEVILSGGGSALKGLGEFVSERLSIKTRVARPFDSVIAPEFLQETLSEIGPSFSVAVGVALRGLQDN